MRKRTRATGRPLHPLHLKHPSRSVVFNDALGRNGGDRKPAAKRQEKSAPDDSVAPTNAFTTFADRHIGPSPEETAQMLREIGFADLDALVDATVPKNIRLDRVLELPAAKARVTPWRNFVPWRRKTELRAILSAPDIPTPSHRRSFSGTFSKTPVGIPPTHRIRPNSLKAASKRWSISKPWSPTSPRSTSPIASLLDEATAAAEANGPVSSRRDRSLAQQIFRR